jgi:hypothetical protein
VSTGNVLNVQIVVVVLTVLKLKISGEIYNCASVKDAPAPKGPPSGGVSLRVVFAKAKPEAIPLQFKFWNVRKRCL